MLAEGVNSEQAYQVAAGAGEFGDLEEGEEALVCYAGTKARQTTTKYFSY